jgi:hypothetical protein
MKVPRECMFTVHCAGPKARYMTQQRYLAGPASPKGGNELDPKFAKTQGSQSSRLQGKWFRSTVHSSVQYMSQGRVL